MRVLLLLVVAAVGLAGCATSSPPTDPYTVVEGPFRVRLTTEPAPPRAGQQATFLFTIEDAGTGTAPEDIEVRPIVMMEMESMEMGVPLTPIEEVEPGHFRTSALLEHPGTLRVSLSVSRSSLVTPVTFPEIQIQAE